MKNYSLLLLLATYALADMSFQCYDVFNDIIKKGFQDSK